MHTIAVIGTGYVGLTTGACFADLGNEVICLDVDAAKIERLQGGELPIYEPGLSEVVERNLAVRRLSFTTSYTEALSRAQFVFIAVGTPDDGHGGADLSQVRSAATSIAQHLHHPVVVVNKSTVPIGTGDLVANIITEHRASEIPVAVVSNPEFLREGTALADCQRPDRVVLGSTDRDAAESVARLYLPLRCPIVLTDLRTAEMIKYASNAFLATRISFINEIAAICEKLGADVEQVALGMGYDARIGHAFLEAGLGFGGSCFPKDVNALMRMAGDAGQHPQLLGAVMEINRDRRRWVMDVLHHRIGSLDGVRIALLGLAFKPDTDDVRESPALHLAHMLVAEGAVVAAYDPVAMPTAGAAVSGIQFCADAYDAAHGAEAVILATSWNEFKQVDLAQLSRIMQRPLLIDGRNLYEPKAAWEAGFEYVGVARGGSVESRLNPTGELRPV